MFERPKTVFVLDRAVTGTGELATLHCKKRKLLRSLQEIQPDFVEEAKA
jgi:hypothetical protein